MSAPLGVTVDRNSPVPLYFQIAEQLERVIDSGELEPGARLDNEVELADRLAVSRPTLRKAIERLVAQGLVVRRRGVGTVVVPRRVKRPIALTSLHDDLTEAGRGPATRVLGIDDEPASPHVAAALGVAEGAPVVSVERVRFADETPLAVMHNYLPGGLLPVTAESLERGGLYEMLRAAGRQPQVASQTIGARTVTPREARLLNTPRSATVLTMTRTAFDSTGRALEYGTHAYLAERYSFEMTLVAR
jgi:DNA-binding GntR family transcriptional regulator